ncbi:winged helix-turn-helix domain-containing protein [Clostridium perfringens]
MGVTIEKEYVVLISIIDVGGQGSKKQVLDNIDENKYINFSVEDLKIKENRNEIKWRNDLAFIRKKLQSKDYIDGSEKNNWKITNKGIYYLFKKQKN